jgi:putative iron-regulated protein
MKKLLISLCALLLTACDKTPEQATPAVPKVKYNLPTQEIISSANLNAYTGLNEAVNQAQNLESCITGFLHLPNPLSLEECQQAWVKAHQAYVRSSFYRLIPKEEKPEYEETQTTVKNLHWGLEVWPIEGGYIDYLPGYPLSGIVNDLTLKINQDTLIGQHGFSNESFASLGFHPMEFLLFGPNGKRSAKDFIPQDNKVELINSDAHDESEHNAESDTHNTINDNTASPAEPQNHNRRREYLKILAGHMLKTLQTMQTRWEPSKGYYAKQLQENRQNSSINRLYQAIMFVVQKQLLDRQLRAIVTEDPLETQHSSFSGTSVADMRSQLEGLHQLWLGNEAEGQVSFNHALSQLDETLAQQINGQFGELINELNKLPVDILKKPLPARQAKFKPIEDQLVQLLELLYTGATLIDIPVQALPISTH